MIRPSLFFAVALSAIACTGSAEEAATGVAQTGTPPDEAWLACDDGTFFVNVFQPRAADGARLHLIFGAHVLTGSVAEDGKTKLEGGDHTFTGTAAVHLDTNTLDVKGKLSLDGDGFAVDKKLSCSSLGRDFGKKGPVLPAPIAHGDSAWLVCANAVVVANVLEHRNANGDGRETELVLIKGRDDVVSGKIVSGAADLASIAGDAGDAFKGKAEVSFGVSPRIRLNGTFSSNGMPITLDEKIACKQLFTDL
jgi:hypothetical protein